MDGEIGRKMSKFFIEIGSADFNTLVPLGKNGWRGIFVDPVKPLLDKLERVDGCEYEASAITDYDGEVTFKYYDLDWIENGGEENEWRKGLGTTNLDTNVLNSNPKHAEYEKIVNVPCMRLDTLIDKYNINNIDFLKIDTEGTEPVILNDYSWKIKPTLMKIECRHWYSYTDEDGNNFDSVEGLNEEQIKDIFNKLKSMGYIVYKENDDLYAVR
jgi:FkbM family methyltransferase